MRLKKTGLILLGVLASLVLLETGLRISGFIYTSKQELRNKEELNKKGVYRILCLGESMTREQYPKYLEDELNSRGIGIKFSVIDKGKGGVFTNFILASLENNLDKYRPDMVVTMMGAMDGSSDVVYEYDKSGSYYRKLKVYKLFKLIKLHMKSKLGEMEKAIGRVTKKSGEGIKELSWGKLLKWKITGRGDNYKETDGEAKKPSEVSVSYVIKGHFYRDRKEYKEAEEMYKKAIEASPDYDQGYLGLGDCYRNTGRYEEAEQVYKKALKINPKSEWNYAVLGDLFRGLKRHEEAEQMYKKSVEVNPNYDHGYLGLGDNYRDELKYEEAGEMYNKAIGLNPKNDQGYMGLGDCYRNERKYKEAEEMYSKAMELNPKNESTYINLGSCYSREGKYKEAEKVFKKAMKLNPKNADTYISLGDSYRDGQKYKKADEMYRKAVELDPKNESAYGSIGDRYMDERKYKEAEEVFKKILEIVPKSEWAYSNLATIYWNQRKFKETEEVYKKMLEINPAQRDAFYGLSVLYEAQNKYKQAEKMLKEGAKPEEDDKRSDENINVTIDDDMGMKHQVIKEKSRSLYFGSGTVYNYKALRMILKKRGVTYVCVQYPRRKVEDMKDIFNYDKDMIYVDNEKTFKEAMKKEGYDKYFKDRTCGEFGHCTVKGNKLLAKNIADAIMKEVFKRQ
ncbi:MAG: tetratricopeptide repeat protein [Elusimicrobia bacterium]|nr:tetratricopeptide repeat protein [Candidatus Liberimonas magnetica]